MPFGRRTHLQLGSSLCADSEAGILRDSLRLTLRRAAACLTVAHGALASPVALSDILDRRSTTVGWKVPRGLFNSYDRDRLVGFRIAGPPVCRATKRYVSNGPVGCALLDTCSPALSRSQISLQSTVVWLAMLVARGIGRGGLLLVRYSLVGVGIGAGRDEREIPRGVGSTIECARAATLEALFERVKRAKRVGAFMRCAAFRVGPVAVASLLLAGCSASHDTGSRASLTRYGVDDIAWNGVAP